MRCSDDGFKDKGTSTKTSERQRFSSPRLEGYMMSKLQTSSCLAQMPGLRIHSAARAPTVDGIRGAARHFHTARHQLCPPGSSTLTSHGRKTPSRVTICSGRSSRAAAVAASGKLSEASLNNSEAMPIEECLTAAEDSPGIYAILDSDETLQYIGMSKNIRSSLERHREKLPGQCASAKALALPSTASKAELQRSWKVHCHCRPFLPPPPPQTQYCRTRASRSSCFGVTSRGTIASHRGQ